MAENQKHGIVIQGLAVQISEPTQKGGRWVTVSTGKDLVSVFFNVEQLRRLPELLSEVAFRISISRSGFVGLVG